MRRQHRLAAVLIAVLVSAGGLAACSSDAGPAPTLQAFLDGWRNGNLDLVGFVDPSGAPVAAASVLTELKTASGDLWKLSRQLHPATPQVTNSDATADVEVDQSVGGNVIWKYVTHVRLHSAAKNAWKVVWSLPTLHPQLVAGQQLALRRVPAVRASILDAAGQELIKPRPVVVVGIEPSLVKNLPSLVATLDAAFKSVHVNVDLSDLPAQVKAAAPTAFVEVVTLRREVYQQISSRIHDLDGTVFQEGTLQLSPSHDFARALLGTVGDVTKEQVDARPGRYVVGDQVGQAGLEEEYEDLLGGAPGISVIAVTPDAQSNGSAGGDSNAPAPPELFRSDPKAGTPLKTTLDQNVQNAADAAVTGSTKRAALVAIRVSDGSILAVANGPAGGALDLALTAQVPPGSTFKVITSYALLSANQITLDSTVDCPATYTVDGRSFKNFGGEAFGPVPFHTDFAKSCNTAFASLAPKLGSDGLNKAAAALGIGTTWQLNTDAYTGSVGTGESAVDQAAAAFGQGSTLVSPIAMAGAAAAVARGAWLQPRLFNPPPTGTPPSSTPVPLDAGAVAGLKTLMREVVTSGTATGLKSVPGAPVQAKTGTAEYDNNPDHAHSWVIGWQGDIAFAVFVEGGGAGADTAVPMAAAFLKALA
jgi:cell division protein FtsI/penicillin-binding protein 2